MRRYLLLKILFLIISTLSLSQVKFLENGQPTLIGQNSGMFPDTPTRLKIDLNGTWEYSIDGKEWKHTRIPSAYDAVGKITFMRNFDITAEMLDRYTFLLVAYGINYQSDILINKNFIGRHLGAYTSIVLHIAEDILQVGSGNTIQINVNNELTPTTTIPLRQQVDGWRNYGGVFRDIYLMAVPRLFIEQVDVNIDISRDYQTAVITTKVEICDRNSGINPGLESTLGLQMELFNKLTGESVGRTGIVIINPQPNKTVTSNLQYIVSNTKLWSPDNPFLYTAKYRIIKAIEKETSLIDEFAVDIGFRNIQWDKGQLLVNNNRTLIKGIYWNEEHPSFGSALTYEIMEQDIDLIKSIGANLIRFQYPPHPYMLNLCDRHGLMALVEVPAHRVPFEILRRDYFQDMLVTYIKEMVNRDKHHASVIAWGIGNELETTTPYACEYINSLRNIIKSMDDRYVYYASSFSEDQCYDYVDIIGINSYTEKPKLFSQTVQELQNKYPDKPIILLRYGKNVQPGNRNGLNDPFSMESQANTIVQFHRQLKELKIAGSVLWSFNDWRSDRPSLSTRSGNPYLITMGIISYDREKRIAFDVTRSIFKNEKVHALPVGNYMASTPIYYVVTNFLVLISLAGLYNRNRRFRNCINRSVIRTYNFFADIRDQHFVSYPHTIFIVIVVSVTWATILSSVLIQYRDSFFVDSVLSQFLPDVLKGYLVLLIWNPAKFILIGSIVIACKLLLLAGIVRLCSMIVRTHVYFYHAFSVTIWSMTPFIIFIPLAMILYNLMETASYIIPIFVFLSIVSLWVTARLFKGISILYDVNLLRIYLGGFIIILVSMTALYGFLDHTRSISVYLKYLSQTIPIME